MHITKLAEAAVLAFTGFALAESGQICTYLVPTNGDPPCSNAWLFGCYDYSEINNEASTGVCQVTSSGIGSYQITGVSQDDTKSCDNFNPAENTVALFFELYTANDCTGADSSFVWTSCENTECNDITSNVAYSFNYVSEYGTGLRASLS
ncbi:hypothetical protein BX600DRAFT_437952 [Xylariales sp. PMI_506]|nr:hypothetical protein BX600DRAFT_437952 [Xylariales sp. PMI_506]